MSLASSRVYAFVFSLLCLLTVSGTATAGEINGALDVALGPQLVLPYGAPAGVHSAFLGGVGSIRIIVDPKSFREEIEELPNPWKQLAYKTKVVRYNPIKWLPSDVLISPGFGTGGALGLSWRPMEIAVSLVDAPRLTVGAAPRLTWISFFGGDIPTTHFMRPGVDLGVEVELPLAERWFLAVGYRSQLYIPQAWGAAPWTLGPQQSWLWHLGQIHMSVHRRRTRTFQW